MGKFSYHFGASFLTNCKIINGFMNWEIFRFGMLLSVQLEKQCAASEIKLHLSEFKDVLLANDYEISINTNKDGMVDILNFAPFKIDT